MIVDLSHASDQTMTDVLGSVKQPVIISHGGCRTFVNHPRCTPDEIIRKLGDGGGVMGVFMMSFWLTTDDPPLATHYIQHIRHIANIAGIEAAAIANDFPVDGEHSAPTNEELLDLYASWWNANAERDIPGFETFPKHVVIPELNTIHRLERIRNLLGTEGFTSSESDLIMGGNWQRVLKERLG